MLFHPKGDSEYGQYHIRFAEPKDAKGIINCMQSVMDERIYLVSEYYLLTERGEQERIRNLDDMTLVAEIDREIIGVLTIQRGMYKKTRHTASLGIAIVSGHRHKGLGYRMIEEAINWCREKGIIKLNLEVFSHNRNAIALYEKIGFQIEGSKKGQFMVEGHYSDDVLMTYWITKPPNLDF